MERLKKIREKIEVAQNELTEINDLCILFPLSEGILPEKKETLKNHLEDIRENIETLLLHSHCSILLKVCKSFLERILRISEGLRITYLVPVYSVSYDIIDTLKTIKSE